MTQGKPVTIGLRARTARAIAIVLGGTSESPVAIHRAELVLALRQDSGHVAAVPRSDGSTLGAGQVGRAADGWSVIEDLASQALAGLVRDVRSLGFAPRSVVVVGAPERNLESIGSPHIRAHAAEGVLYRHALEVAAGANDLRSRAVSEKGLLAIAEAELGLTAQVIRSRLVNLGEEFGRPWRADQKLAATAAWLALVELS